MFFWENFLVFKVNRIIVYGIVFVFLGIKFVKIYLKCNGSEFIRLCIIIYYKIYFYIVGDGFVFCII